MCVKGVMGFAIGIMVACGICFLGVFLAFGVSFSENKKANDIGGLPGKTFAEFSESGDGDEVAITGQLTDNAILTSIYGSREDSTADYELVAAQVHQWNVTQSGTSNNNSNPTTRGTWQFVGLDAPNLNLKFQDDMITILNEQAGKIEFGGGFRTIYEKTSSGLSAKSGTETYYDGTVRIEGFRDGSLVTVVGVKNGDDGVVPERLFGGSRAQLADDLKAGARTMVVVGFSLMVCSVFIVLASVLGMINRLQKGLTVTDILRRGLRI